MGFPRQEYWRGLLCPLLRDLSDLGIKPWSPALWVDSLPTELQGKPKNTGAGSLSLLQHIFLAQELNRGLLHCRWTLYQLSYQGSLVSPNSNLFPSIILTQSKSVLMVTMYIKSFWSILSRKQTNKQTKNRKNILDIVFMPLSHLTPFSGSSLSLGSKPMSPGLHLTSFPATLTLFQVHQTNYTCLSIRDSNPISRLSLFCLHLPRTLSSLSYE